MKVEHRSQKSRRSAGVQFALARAFSLRVRGGLVGGGRSSLGSPCVPQHDDLLLSNMICDAHTCGGCRYLEQDVRDDRTASVTEFLANCQHAKCKVVRLVRQQISKLQNMQVRIPAFPVIGRAIDSLRRVLTAAKIIPLIPSPPPQSFRRFRIAWRTSPSPSF